MGYENRFTGAITISPQLTRKQIREVAPENFKDVRFRIVEEQVESDDGETVTVRTTADAIVPLDIEYSGYNLEGEIQGIVDAFGEHEFAGFIEARWDAGFGEPPSRFIIKDDRVMRIDAQYRWPGIWPDEQDDPFAMVAEDVPDGPARAVVEHWFSHAALISDSVGSPEWHAVADMTRRILDLMDAEQDDRAAAGRPAAEAIVRLKAWLTGRQANAHSKVSSTNVIAEPRDRSTAAWAIAESDVRAVVAAFEAKASES